MAPPRPRKAAPPMKKRPPACLNNADWKTSKAKLLVSQDIIDGLIPVEGAFDVEELFNAYYKNHEFFANFPFDKTRYNDRINRLRKAIGNLRHWSIADDAALKADRQIYPANSKNVRGQIRWVGSEAERLLKLDIDAEVHLQPGYAPRKLHKADHGQYLLFSLTTFRKHIKQELTSRKTFDDKTLKKRRTGYKVGRFGNRTLTRETTGTNTASNETEV